MTIKTKALRDRRPKTKPVELETVKGNTIKFQNPFKSLPVREAEKVFAKMESAESVSAIRETFIDLAANGQEDWDTYEADDDPTLEDLQDVLGDLMEEFQEQAGGSLGESKG